MIINHGNENSINISQVDYVVEGSNTPLPTISAKEATDVEKAMAGHIVKLMAMGGKGVISVLANVAPDVAHNIAQLCLDGDYAKARELQLQYLELINALFLEVNPIPVKMAMRFLGWDVGELRMPLCDMTEEHVAQLKQAMANAGYPAVK